jgi:hypothetical protein
VNIHIHDVFSIARYWKSNENEFCSNRKVKVLTSTNRGTFLRPYKKNIT